jgi:aryl-alcohol dehydrogenase-like predicted oxidoreductase
LYTTLRTQVKPTHVGDARVGSADDVRSPVVDACRSGPSPTTTQRIVDGDRSERDRNAGEGGVIMERRTLGADGPTVSAIGLGTMGVAWYGTPDDDEALATITEALDLGMDFLDTADVYASGHSEELVGQAIRGRRDQVVLATKFGNLLDDKGAFAGVSGRPEYVKQACDASLRRLSVDVIDLYYQHRVDPKTPIEETIGAVSELVGEGKVRYVGLSEAGADTIRRAHAIHPIAALQTEYSLLTRDVEDEILPAVRELGIGFVAYSPLGRALLTGTIREVDSDLIEGDHRRKFPRFQGENLRHNVGIVDRLGEVADAKGCTPAQLAIAWLLARGDDIVPIAGTKRRRYLQENVGALEVELTLEDLDRIDGIAPPGAAAGDRYHAQAMAKLGL